MTVTRIHILQELRRNVAECARLLQQQQELLKQMEAAFKDDLESETQAQINDLRTQLERGEQ